jgi:hypothetical protein
MISVKRVVLCLSVGLVFSGCGSALFAQGGRANSVPKSARPNPPDPATKPLNAHERFAYDAVRAAVALPQSEPQDRLRVLAAAASVIAPIRPALAKSYSSEGLRVEQELIQRGETPAASMLGSGPVDCKAVQSLVESIPAQRVDVAEATLVGAIAACPTVSLTVQRLIDGGMDEKKLAPRAALALMDHAGLSSAWSQEEFVKLFDSLPMDAAAIQREAPNLATTYAAAAGKMEKAAAKKSGLQLLLWLGKLPESGDRALSISVTAGAMKQALGPKDFEDAMASDVMVRQIAQKAGGPGQVSRPMDDSISVLKAMQAGKEDRVQELEALPPSRRAREAAASGFASGTGGNLKLASRYFDLAFSSLNAVWSDRQGVRDAAEIVQEVSEAAAQVNSMDALQRARGLDDTAAQAIGMISVARVVSGNQQAGATSASR